jgi:hypothetical protein
MHRSAVHISRPEKRDEATDEAIERTADLVFGARRTIDKAFGSTGYASKNPQIVTAFINAAVTIRESLVRATKQ